MKSDKRRSVRRPVECTAWIARQGEPLEACALADISDKGARLDVMDINTIPDEFMLFLSPRGNPRRWCRVAWRANSQLGVRFEAPPSQKKDARAMIAARQASLQPDMDAPDATPTAEDKTVESGEPEPA
jgi:hypothetical protein